MTIRPLFASACIGLRTNRDIILLPLIPVYEPIGSVPGTPLVIHPPIVGGDALEVESGTMLTRPNCPDATAYAGPKKSDTCWPYEHPHAGGTFAVLTANGIGRPSPLGAVGAPGTRSAPETCATARPCTVADSMPKIRAK